MKKYIIYINGNRICVLLGCEQAYEAFKLARSFCEAVNAECDLVDAQTDEVIESFGYDAEEVEDINEPYDIDDECGFDPYEGCFTYDC